MALKHVRPEKRVPAFHLMVTGVIFVVVFLIAVWVFSSPAEVQPEEKGDVSRADAVGLESGEDLPTRGGVAGAGEEDPGFIDRDKPDPAAEFVDDGGDGEGKEVEDVKPEPKPDTDSDPVLQGGKDVEELDASGEEKKGEVVKEEPKEEENPKEEEEPKVDDTPIVEIKADPAAVTGQDGNPSGAELTLDNTEKATSWKSQSVESKEETGSGDGEEADRKGPTAEGDEIKPVTVSSGGDQSEGDGAPNDWKSCEWSGAQDYIPCLDNQKAISQLKSTKHYEHRERHCPAEAEMPKCLVPLPEGYQVPITWPESRSKVWYSNVPYTKLATYKADQNWVKKRGDYLIFPGGGTQFKAGAGHYIDFIEKSKTDVAWGKRTRVILDVGCGVASFGGFLFDRDVLAMSLAPKDEHEAQVQFALERGIPAISAVMGTQRLPFPSNVFDVVHCARCRVPWEIEGGMLLLELNRMLRPGGFFVWSATPVYKRAEADDWKAMLRLTSKICWDLLSRTTDATTGIGVAIFQKPTDNTCYDNRKKNFPPLCGEDDKPDAAWYVSMNACVHRLPEGDVRGAQWPEQWPRRLTTVPAWLYKIPKGLYGRPAGEEFQENSEHWSRVIQKLYLKGLGIDWTHVRNVMDMSAGYGGFAAALADQPLWVMNVVPTHEPDTLPIIYERGLFGIYHDWCESFSTYPRTYDLLHSDHVFSRLKKRCGIVNTLIEVDRIVRPEGWVIFRDKTVVLAEDVLPVLNSLHWLQIYHDEQDLEQIVVMQKSRWRPDRSA